MTRGFTLVELLVVITILLILTMVGIFVYRDLNAKARDATRIEDLNSIRNAISIVMHDATDSAAILCNGSTPPCEETSFPTDSSTRLPDGTGWIPVNFDAKDIATFNQLPLDPSNDDTYNFHYYSDGINWKIDAALESPTNQGHMTSDGGTKADRYEVGTRIRSLP